MQGDVAVFKEFNLKSHYQARHAANYDKLARNEQCKKWKQLGGVLMAQQRFSQELVSQMKMPQKRATRWQRWLQGTANLLLMVNLLKTGWWKWLRTFVLRRSKTLPTFACLVTLWHGELRTFRPLLRDKDKGCRVWFFFSVSLRQSTDATDIAQLLIFWEEWMVNVNVSKELRSKTPADGAAALDNFYCPLDNGRFQEIRTFGKKKSWAYLARHTCARRHSHLWTLTRTVWGQDQVASCASKPLSLSQTWPFCCNLNLSTTHHISAGKLFVFWGSLNKF